ncbi:MAG: N-acetylmuramoyl-L-alanine amidase, partial [Clostridiales bacterium]|nr:N-acetylmuramoyl-L-alanine amidase [Clostridiales bacterium]
GVVPVTRSSIVSSVERIDGTNSVTLRFHLNNAGVFYVYSLSYDDKGYLCIDIKEKPSSLQNTVIMLDAGHGGTSPEGVRDVGTAGKGIAEKLITLQLVKKIQALLVAQGATVILTRDSDTYLSIQQRRQLTYQYSPDLFLSIHCDGSEDIRANGTRSFYYKCFSKDYADALHEALYDTYTNELGRTITNRASAYYVFAVTRTEVCPSVLLETGFLTNISGTSNDFTTLTSEAGQNAIAAAVVRGIENYYGF